MHRSARHVGSRLGVLGLWLLLAVSSASAQVAPHTLTTGDGLTIGFDDLGRLVFFGNGTENEVPDGATGGFYVRDLQGNGPVPSLDPLGFVDDGVGNPLGWSVETQSQMTLTFEPRGDGGNFLRLDSSSSSGQIIMSFSPQPVVGGDFYRLELGTRTAHGYYGTGSLWDGVCEATVSIRWLDEFGQLDSTDTVVRIAFSTRDWKRMGGLIKAPNLAEEAVIEIAFRGAIPGTQAATVWLDDVAFGAEPTVLVWPEGTISSNPSDIQGQLQDAASGFAVVFAVTAGPVGFRIEGEVTNTDGAKPSRAIDLGFGLPLDAIGWNWWDDIVESREILTRFFTNAVNVDETGSLSLSVYPLSAVENGERGYSLAWPMEEPRIARIEYDLNDELFSILFALGLSDQTTRFANKASFGIRFYAIPDPAWGFRSAMERYYLLEEDAFAEKIVDGAPLRRGADGMQNDKIVEQPQDFSLGLLFGRYLGEGTLVAVDYAADNGMWAVHYTRPWDIIDAAATLDQAVPNYEDVLADLVTLSMGDDLSAEIARGAANSYVLESNGNVQFQRFDELFNGRPGEWSARLPLNLDPEIPGTPNSASVVPDADLGPGIANIVGHRPDVQIGWFLDGYFTSSRHLDHRSDRWGFADLPLTYSPNTLTPAAHVALQNIEFMEWMQGIKQAEYPDIITVGNFNNPGISGLGAQFVDMVVYEIDAESLSAEVLANNRRYRRFLARYRPVSELYNRGPFATVWSSYSQFEAGYLRKVWAGGMAYGIFPASLAEMIDIGLDIDAARSFYTARVPAMNALQDAGWEPVPHAVVSDPELLVERFGSGDTTHLVVYNGTTSARGYSLEVTPGALGMGGVAQVSELLTGAVLSGTDAGETFTINDTVAAETSRVLRLIGGVACAGDVNLDGIVDGLDLLDLAPRFGTDSSDALWDVRLDLNEDNVIDGIDLSLLAADFGLRTCLAG